MFAMWSAESTRMPARVAASPIELLFATLRLRTRRCRTCKRRTRKRRTRKRRTRKRRTRKPWFHEEGSALLNEFYEDVFLEDVFLEDKSSVHDRQQTNYAEKNFITCGQ
jgi:transposase